MLIILLDEVFLYELSLLLNIVVFRPFPTEVITGKVIASTNEGLLISLGFFDNIIIPKNLLQSPSVFNSETQSWNWKYDGCEETDDDLSFTISLGDKVRNVGKIYAQPTVLG